MRNHVLSIILSAVVFISLPAQGYANSGPVFWQGYPASDIMLIKENSPIIIPE